MIHRSLPGAMALLALLAARGEAQNSLKSREPSFDGRSLSSWVKDLDALAPSTRNAAAYAISSMGAAAKPAVPALIHVLEDQDAPATVRYPVCVALREIGPAAKEAVPALTEAMDDRNDDIASMARQALRAITGEDPRPSE
ncbi:MAG TPA: HEAT repeat domain-containing protein [Gemmatimonadales bacterium]|nr:HEAT repeat domain-containing protein [Gemmatimonadales bacterium]